MWTDGGLDRERQRAAYVIRSRGAPAGLTSNGPPSSASTGHQAMSVTPKDSFKGRKTFSARSVHLH